MMRLPPPTEPVKQTFATSSLVIRAAMSASLPVTTLRTPAGSFSAMRCTRRVVASGADGGGLTIAVLPASSACGRAAPRIAIGQLNGTITVTTPSGWYETVVSTGMPGTTGRVFPVSTSSAIIRARFQRISKTSASIQLSKRILPFSCDRMAASVSRSSAMPAIASAIFAARSVALSRDHAGNAAFAALIASSTS